MSSSAPPPDPDDPDHRSSDDSGRGFVPYKDPVVLLLAIILVGTAIAAVGGLSAGPILSGNESDGSVFGVDRLFNDSDDDRETVQLHIDANRTSLRATERVRLRVTDSDGDPVPSAYVGLAGNRHDVDETGTVTVAPQSVGAVTVTASAPATNETAYADASMTLDVDRAQVELGLRANRSTVTVDEPVALELFRTTDNRSIDGTVTFANREYEVDDSGRVVVRPGRAGELQAVGNRSATESAVYRSGRTTVVVERRTVQLGIDAAPDRVTVGENVTVSVNRTDTGAPVEATVEYGNQSAETTAGQVTLAIGAAGEYDLRATRSSTRTERFEAATTTVRVDRRSVDLTVLSDRPVTTAGGTIRAELLRADTRTPVNGTIAVGNREFQTSANDTARIQLNETGPATLVGSAPDTAALTFASVERTVDVTGGRVSIVDTAIPADPAPGERIRANVTLENVGNESAEDTIVYRFDGVVQQADLVALDPGETTEQSVELVVPERTGAVELAISSGTDRTGVVFQLDDGSDTDNRVFPIPR